MEPPTESPGASAHEPQAEATDAAVEESPVDSIKKAGPDGEEYFEDGAAADNSKEQGEETKAAPQAHEPEWAKPDRQGSLADSEGDMSSIKLTPVDYARQRQNLKDNIMKSSDTKPPFQDEGPGGDNGAHHVHFDEEDHQHSALHQEEYAQNESGLHNPQIHESALAGPGGAGLESSGARGKKPFKARKKNRLVQGADGKKGHSNPRKSPYKTEIGRLRHAQQLEREKRQFASDNNGGKDPPDLQEESSSTASGRSLGIKDTTAPPETSSFAIQSSKLKHSLLHSLGEFLTGAFADDEESSGSYFGQELLDRLSNSDPYVKGVWLQAKSLNDNHVKQLCEALIRNRVVTEVWLPGNQITDAGAAHVAHMLKFNRSIKELFLGENDIGPKGAAALASALARGNTTLVALGLGDNHIGVEGAGAFAAALRHNHSLHTLDIKNNGIPKRSSIRGLLGKMLEFNASDPGDESLVLGLQEELANLVRSLPPEVAENVVLQAEEALKSAMLCRRRGDKVGAAEAEGIFIRICTTGEPPVDPPEEEDAGPRKGQRQAVVTKKKRRPKKPIEPDRLDSLNEELGGLEFKEGGREKEEPEERGDGVEEGQTPKNDGGGAKDENETGGAGEVAEEGGTAEVDAPKE